MTVKKDVLRKPHGSHKAKTYSKYTQKMKKESRITAYHYRKSSYHKGREQEKKKWRKEPQNSYKTMNKMVITKSILNNYFKWKD